jgi:hypothetical protein
MAFHFRFEVTTRHGQLHRNRVSLNSSSCASTSLKVIAAMQGGNSGGEESRVGEACVNKKSMQEGNQAVGKTAEK